MRPALLFFFPALLTIASCTKDTREPGAPASTPAQTGTLPVPVPDPAASTPTPTPAPSPPPTTTASSSSAPPADPPVRVKIATIGMHVGGGPYDEITKEPMKRSVEPRFPDLARCWKLVTRPVSADVGVDLVIEAAGGRARVSNPRASIAGEGFVPCVVAFFESVDFQKPNNGKTVVSYSVRFTPEASPR